MSADKKSSIRIFDSTVTPQPGDVGKRIEFDDLSRADTGHNAAGPKFSKEAEAALDKWRVAGRPQSRGAAP